MNEFQQTMQAVHCKSNFNDMKLQPFVINRTLSMGREDLQMSAEIDQYVFWVQKELLHGMFWYWIKKKSRVPWHTFVKKPKPEKGQYDIVLEKIRDEYNISKREFEKSYKHRVLKMLENKSTLYKALCRYGFEKRVFTKFGFKIDVKAIKKKEDSGQKRLF